MNMLAGFVLLVAGGAALYLVAVIRQQFRLQRGLPIRFHLLGTDGPARRGSTGGRHRARKHVVPMRAWDDTGPLPLAEIALEAARWRRSSC